MSRPVGYKHTEESLQKMRDKKQGYLPWNTGKVNVYSQSHLENLSSKLKGHSVSLESKNKMSLAKKGKPLSEAQWNQINQNALNRIGKPLSKDIIAKMSGSNHWNWQGGKSFELYPLGWNKTFKEQIRHRDKYTCQKCGIPEIELNKTLCVHHIDLNKKNLNPDNLISLCRSCHIKHHHSLRKWWNVK